MLAGNQQAQAGARNPAARQAGNQLAPIPAIDQGDGARADRVPVYVVAALTSRSTLAAAGIVPAVVSW